MAAVPNVHGPHCCADSLAKKRSRRAACQRPHTVSGTTVTAAQPRSLPQAPKLLGVRATPWCKASTGSHPPKYPPGNTAWIPCGAPQPITVMTSRRATPLGTSTTPVRRTAPFTVRRMVPGSSSVPTDRNQAGPLRTIRAAWARARRLRLRRIHQHDLAAWLKSDGAPFDPCGETGPTPAA
jgi:hypothetical protein